MLDIKLLRERPGEVEKQLKRRDSGLSLAGFLEVDRRWRETVAEADRLKHERNRASEEIARRKRSGEDASDLIDRMQEVSVQVKRLDEARRDYEGQLRQLLLTLPNLPQADVPEGGDKEDGIVLRRWGEQPRFDFTPQNHVELGRRLRLFDFERASRMAGSQFPMYVGLGARLEWALINFMLDIQVKENGFTHVFPPCLVNADSLITSGNLPKFADQLYFCQEDGLYLIPTSEVPLANIHRDEVLAADELPLRYTAYTPNFRREAGAYGAGERGLIRVHQFNKIEMFSFVRPEDSRAEQDRMVECAEAILQRLELHHRTVLLPTGDIAQQSARTVDVEVWLPGQQAYYEVSSCSNCEDYQARRGNIRYRRGDERPAFVHTLNGSGLATSRLMVALLETNQQPDGSVRLPRTLVPYMGGLDRLEPVDG